ncbi:hypothetical protein ACIRSS_21410 [Amycolatopsis sp. NPDC101161]|uniref:hypothetical protein n=1 Tax=Amycolatopsis sp. NPDC101161 TaxID=3363940 RepID=UPI0037F7B03A
MTVVDEEHVGEAHEPDRREVGGRARQPVPAIAQRAVARPELAVEVAGAGDRADDALQRDVVDAFVDLGLLAERLQGLPERHDREVVGPPRFRDRPQLCGVAAPPGRTERIAHVSYNTGRREVIPPGRRRSGRTAAPRPA